MRPRRGAALSRVDEEMPVPTWADGKSRISERLTDACSPGLGNVAGARPAGSRNRRAAAHGMVKLNCPTRVDPSPGGRPLRWPSVPPWGW
jgi:hypothetical protein